MSESKHADLLNALDEMQRSIAYAARRGILAEAERVIAEQERQLIAAAQGQREWPKLIESGPLPKGHVCVAVGNGYAFQVGSHDEGFVRAQKLPIYDLGNPSDWSKPSPPPAEPQDAQA